MRQRTNNCSAWTRSFQHMKNFWAVYKLIIVSDDAPFVAAALNNFLWVAFTRCNPSHDIYGVNAFTHNKHWGCKGPLIIDARVKPHHAPILEQDPQVSKNIERIFNKGGSLYNKLA